MPRQYWESPSLLSAGLRCRCPRCGEGPVFGGYLGVVDHCAVCGLDLGRNDSADGPAVFLIFVIGTVGVLLALLIEISFTVPVWVPVSVASLAVVALTALVLRPCKAYWIALQFRLRRDDFEHPPPVPEEPR